MKQIRFRAMGSQVEAFVDSDAAAAEQLLQHLPDWFETWEQSLSRFRSNSELSDLNRSQGESFRTSATLWRVLKLAQQARHHSGGLVIPEVLGAVEAAGYERSFETMQAVDGPYDLFPEFAANQYEVQVQGQHRLYMPPGVRLDLGGVAKGWAAHQAVQRLSRQGPALVNAGGDVAVGNGGGRRHEWPVGVIDPFHPEEQLATLKIQSGGVATSGRDYHRWLRNGIWQHHIIDPRSGRPAETDLVSATILAQTVMDAETAAKTVFILGSQQGLAWLEARSSLAGLLVLEDGSLQANSKFEAYLWR